MKKIFFFLILFLSISLNAQWVFQNCDNSVANNFWDMSSMWSNGVGAFLDVSDNTAFFEGTGSTKIDYNIVAGESWGGYVSRQTTQNQEYYDFSAGEFISFQFKILTPLSISQTGEFYMEFKLLDYDNNNNYDIWLQRVPIDLTDASNNWINIKIPLIQSNDSQTGFINQFAFNNGIMELDRIKNFEWAFVFTTAGGGTPNPTGSGSILVDRWELTGNKYPPLNTFDNTTVNFYNIDDMNWAGEADKSSILLTDNLNDKIEGDASLKMDYTVNASQDWGGYVSIYKDIIKPNGFENRSSLVIYIKNELPHSSPNITRLDLNFYIVEDNTGVDETWRIRLPINLSQVSGWTRYVLPLKQGLVTAPMGTYILPTDGFAQYFGGEQGDNIFNFDHIKSYGIEVAAAGTSAGPLGEKFTGTILFDLLQQGGNDTDNEAPEAPSNFTVTSGTYNNTFNWSDVTNEGAGEKYLIYGCNNPFTDITEPGVELIGFYYENVGNGIHYLRSPKVDANVTNYYGIRSVDLANNIGPFAFASPVTNMAKGIGVISLNPPVNFNADGDLSEWNNYQPIEIKLSNQTGFIGPNYNVGNDADLSALARIAMDNKYLYVAFDVNDDNVISNGPVPSYINDSPELLIGLYDLIGVQHNSFQRGDYPDYHLRFNQFALSSDNSTMVVNNLLLPGLNYGWFEKFPSGGYIVEAKIPLADLAQMRDNYGEQTDKTFIPLPGMKIPLDINLNDQDVPGSREGLLYFSNMNEDNSWNDPQRWGNTWTDTKYLMLVAPREISVFNPTEVIPLQWNYAGLTNVKIEFSSDGSNYTLVEASVPANQTYNWTVPNVESNNCFLRITDVDNLFYTSKNPDPFTITIANYTLEQEDNNGFSKANQTQLGNIISGELIDGDDTDFFRFSGNEGDLIDIDAYANNSTLFGMVFLFDANKNQIAGSQNYMEDHLRQRIVFTLPETGEYYIRYSTVWNYNYDINSSIKDKSEATVTDALFRGAYKIALKLWQVSEPQLSWSVRNSDLFSNDCRIEIEAASNGNPITLKYAYSTDFSYSNSIPDQNFPAATWNYWATSDKIYGLTPNTLYNVRVTLESTYGTIESFGQFTTPPTSQTFVKKANLGGFLNDIEFSGTVAYAVGSGIFRSYDNGSNWSEVNAIPFFREIYSVEGVGTSEIATFGNHIIVKSMDGGATWGYEEFPSNNWRDIDFIDFNNGFFCGDGEIIRSTDNGANGTNIYTGDINFNRIIMHDVNTVYAVGDQGAIFKTTDAGNNYSITFHNYKGWQLYGIDFFDYNNGVAVGENGNLLTTTDGGETWNQHYEFNETLYDVKMVSATEFYIVGNNGLIIHSTDGGNNFDIIESGTRNRLKRIAINNGRMWICGDWGTVLGPKGEPCDVKFVIDMRIQHLEGKFDPATDNVSIRGSFNGWSESPMTDPNHTGLYSTTLSLFNNTNYEYKFFTSSQTALNGGWERNVGEGGPTENRVLSIADETQLNLQPDWFDKKAPELTWYSTLRVEDGTDLFSGFFGTHPNATDGIDQNIFESSLQSNPQAGAIDLRFAIPGGSDHSVRDFRNDSNDYIEWIINFQRGSGTDPIKLRWNPNEFPADIYIVISDPAGTAFALNMMDNDFIEITDPGITSVKIVSKKIETKQSELNSGWNLVSVPVTNLIMSPASIFPNSVSSVWGFNGAYYAESQLQTGKGYWEKNSIDETLDISGIKPESFIINLVQGWNLIGVFDRDAIITSITTTPINIISSSFFGYNNGYFVPFKLGFGKGFWVQASAAGTIDLSPFKSSSISKENFISSQYASAPEINSNWGRIIISDSEGRQGVLYDSDKEKANLNLYELPPIPPSGIFDIRYESNRYVENLSSTMTIKINSDKYPIKIKPEGIDLMIDGMVVKKGTEISINKEMPGIINVSRVEIPISFILMQNYPNPFNPSTIIRFGLPEQTNVHLEIFNVLGERVDELINKEMEPGFHEITWNAKSLPSGIYIYSIRTSQFNDVKKMMFIK